MGTIYYEVFEKCKAELLTVLSGRQWNGNYATLNRVQNALTLSKLNCADLFYDTVAKSHFVALNRIKYYDAAVGMMLRARKGVPVA